MLLGVIPIKAHPRDEIFVPGRGPQGGEFYLPYRRIRDLFAERGIELHTADMAGTRKVDFELHINAQHRLPEMPAYAYLYEDPIVRPVNGDRAHLMGYRKVFTNNRALIDGAKFLRLDYPNDLTLRSSAPWHERDLFCVMIARNNALLRPHPDNLHHRRLRTLMHFERAAPDLFALYGKGWDQPPIRAGVWGKAVKRVRSWRNRVLPARAPFATWRGPVHTKGEVYRRARFAITYENSRGAPGYLTEKIFDAMVWGCVPIYLGVVGATADIPRACFIDADDFEDEAHLTAFLRGITPQRHAAYQSAIRDFLASPAALPYGNEHFARTLVQTIVDDLAIALPRPAAA
jgi:hypothetical protein